MAFVAAELRASSRGKITLRGLRSRGLRQTGPATTDTSLQVASGDHPEPDSGRQNEHGAGKRARADSLREGSRVGEYCFEEQVA